MNRLLKRPLLSLIVLTYNNEDTVDRCLNSILRQTFESFEIIIIDDSSDDSTPKILDKYAMCDERISILKHKRNMSAHISRREGALLARGKYTWFIDGDDTISDGSIESVLQEMERDPVSILHFNTLIINDGNLSKSRIDKMISFVRPYEGYLKGSDIFKKCFLENAYRFSIWNKLFDSNICKNAFSKMISDPLPKGQDKYEYLAISMMADTYRGTSSIGDYEYHFGAGLTGSLNMSVEKFSRFCTMARTADAADSFMKSIGKANSAAKTMEKFRRELAMDCISNWINNVAPTERTTCFEILVNSWGPAEVAGYLYTAFMWKWELLTSKIIDSPLLDRKRKEIKCIGTFYRNISNGGVQRVLTKLA